MLYSECVYRFALELTRTFHRKSAEDRRFLKPKVDWVREAQALLLALRPHRFPLDSRCPPGRGLSLTPPPRPSAELNGPERLLLDATQSPRGRSTWASNTPSPALLPCWFFWGGFLSLAA